MKNDPPPRRGAQPQVAPGGPNEDLSPDLRYIGGLVAKIQDTRPPESLLAGVMAGITPQKPSAGRRLWRFLTRPQTIRFTPIKWIPATILVAVLLTWLGVDPPPQPPAMDLAAGQTASTDESHRFTLHLDKSASVAVIGDFNNWNPKGFEMHWDETCRCYTLFLPLPPGRYQYAFLVDGRILADPQAALSQDDGFGHKNSIIIINHDHRHEKKI